MSLKLSLNDDTRGFTLIELMVTVGMVGILSAIASHNFLAYISRSYDSRAESSIHDAATAEEAYYAENERYASCVNAACNSVLDGFLLSVDVQLSMESVDGDQAFTASSEHPSGGKIFSFESSEGKFTWDPK